VLRKHQPKIVVVYEDNFNFLSKMCLTRMREVAFHLAQKAKANGAITIVNGSDATDHLAEYLQQGFDYLLAGEAEWTLLEFVKQLLGSSPRNPAEIPGLIYLDPVTGDLTRTPLRKLMADLDALPLPAWDMVDADRYRSLWMKAHGFFSLNMVSSRGCPTIATGAKPIYGTSLQCPVPERLLRKCACLKTAWRQITCGLQTTSLR
jgi:radical SAM superfamily enzyme YgiQ (UPF0313 family)